MRSVISWAVWALLALILFYIPYSLGRDAIDSLPGARTLARAYAGSPSCQPAMLLHPPAGLLSPPARPTAPGGPLCVVESMIVRQKSYAKSRKITFDSLTLVNRDGAEVHVTLGSNSHRFWLDLRPPQRVAVQFVNGKIATVANGAALARTAGHPDVLLRSLRVEALLAAPFSLPFLGFLAISLRAWMKKSRRHPATAVDPSRSEARA